MSEPLVQISGLSKHFPTKIPWPKRPGEPECTWADVTKIQTQLGWRPRVSFEEGVRTVLENIEYWRGAPLWDPDTIAAATHTWFTMLSAQAR